MSLLGATQSMSGEVREKLCNLCFRFPTRAINLLHKSQVKSFRHAFSMYFYTKNTLADYNQKRQAWMSFQIIITGERAFIFTVGYLQT